MSWILDLVFPKKCVGCGRLGEYACKDCEVGLWEEEQICPSCGRNSRYGLRHRYCKGDMEGLVCFWAYEGVAKRLITKAKYSGQFDALKFLISSFEFSDKPQLIYFQKFLETKPVVVPVPLHPRRLGERGFNQAEIIGRSFAARHLLECDGRMLIRIRETKPQVGRTREERLKAMEGVFELVSGGGDLGPAALVVDDVWTTGATMRECAKMMKKARVKHVWGLALAR